MFLQESDIEPEMIFKDSDELPHHYRYITEFLPKPGEKVRVIELVPFYQTFFVKVEFGLNQRCTVNPDALRSPAKHKLRQVLLRQTRSPRIERMLRAL